MGITRPILMTQAGYDKTRQELDRKVLELQAICEERLLAHSLSGDVWHDNPYFNRLQQMEAEKTRDIVHVQSLIHQTKIINIDSKARPKNRVSIGSIVQLSICNHKAKKELIQTWKIVGFIESDAELKKLAYNSPLASEILNLMVGDDIDIMLPSGLSTVEILSFQENVS